MISYNLAKTTIFIIIIIVVAIIINIIACFKQITKQFKKPTTLISGEQTWIENSNP